MLLPTIAMNLLLPNSPITDFKKKPTRYWIQFSKPAVPDFLAPGTGFVEDSFSMDGGGTCFQFFSLLTSSRVAQFLTDNETLPVHGSGLWTPELGDRKTEIQKSSFCNMQPFPGERKKDNLALAGTVSISYYTIKKDTESQKNF